MRKNIQNLLRKENFSPTLYNFLYKYIKILYWWKNDLLLFLSNYGAMDTMRKSGQNNSIININCSPADFNKAHWLVRNKDEMHLGIQKLVVRGFIRNVIKYYFGINRINLDKLPNNINRSNFFPCTAIVLGSYYK